MGIYGNVSCINEILLFYNHEQKKRKEYLQELCDCVTVIVRNYIKSDKKLLTAYYSWGTSFASSSFIRGKSDIATIKIMMQKEKNTTYGIDNNGNTVILKSSSNDNIFDFKAQLKELNLTLKDPKKFNKVGREIAMMMEDSNGFDLKLLEYNSKDSEFTFKITSKYK